MQLSEREPLADAGFPVALNISEYFDLTYSQEGTSYWYR